MTKLLTAEEVASGALGQIDYLNQELTRWKTITKSILARQGEIVLHNALSGEDEIQSFNCSLCEKVGNCTVHKGTYIICDRLEYKEGWEEIG